MPNTHDDIRNLSRQMHDIITHAQSLVDATSDELDDRIKSARSALRERLASAQDEYGVIENRLAAKVKQADELIHAKPYYAIGGSFLAGLLFGWAITRK